MLTCRCRIDQLPTSGVRIWDGDTVFAMILEEPGQLLVGRTLPERAAGPGEILARVTACAVCRTDLHVVDGDSTASCADPRT
jgi:D-arabinose 1-dehydrogenase-like Zn-dependent alcohol dehydrogenase